MQYKEIRKDFLLLLKLYSMINSQEIKELAKKIGFDLVGISIATPTLRDLTSYKTWIKKKMHGDMGYMERVSPRENPGEILQNAKSVICCAVNYNQTIPKALTEYKIARYAFGKDYHKVMQKKLKQLWQEIRRLAPEAKGKYFVDTGPILERAFARQTQIGWIGKNTMLISKNIGSYIFLGEIITDLELKPDSPATDHCGSCTACLDACPTKAFPEPGLLDSRKCISYWTIEHRGEFPEEINTNGYLFGCDICQEVCPWNRKAPTTKEAKFFPLPLPTLKKINSMNEKDFSEWFNGRPIKRAKIEGLKRNSAMLLKTPA